MSAASVCAPDPRLRAAVMARELTRAGLGKGSRLAAVLSNGPEFVALFLACLELEITFVPLNPLPRVTSSFAGAGRRLPMGTWSLERGPPVRRVPGWTARWQGRLPGRPPVYERERGRRPGRSRFQKPLCCMSRTRTIRRWAMAQALRVVGFLPWSHAFGFTLELLMALLHEGALWSVPRGRLSLKYFQARRPTFCLLFREWLSASRSASLKRLRGGIVGGAPVRGDCPPPPAGHASARWLWANGVRSGRHFGRGRGMGMWMTFWGVPRVVKSFCARRQARPRRSSSCVEKISQWAMRLPSFSSRRPARTAGARRVTWRRASGEGFIFPGSQG